MKKIFTLCSLILTLAVLLTVFTACGTKNETESTEPSQNVVDNTDVSREIVIENPAELTVGNFAVQIGDTSAVVSVDGKFYQTLKYPHSPNKTFNKAYASQHYEFIDMNFDGVLDFYIAINSADGVISYYCWLFNASTGDFEYSVSLSALNNLTIDKVNQKIHVKTKDGDANYVGTYQWVNGELMYEKRYTESDLPEEYTNVIKEESIGVQSTVTKPAETTKETADKNDKPVTNSDKESITSTESTTASYEKPVTTTEASGSSNVQLAPGSIDEGWVNL